MGCSCLSKPVEMDGDYALSDWQVPHGTTAYLGMAMMEASRSAASTLGADAHRPSAASICAAPMEADAVDALVRRAKNEGCTLSVKDGELFVDYKFVGHLPYGFNVRL